MIFSIISKRSFKSSLMMKDGSTILIGSMHEEQDHEAKRCNPLLHHLPIVGSWLCFGSNHEHDHKQLIFTLHAKAQYD